jgi:RNA polymerase sigma factor for flagellar operon FliA
MLPHQAASLLVCGEANTFSGDAVAKLIDSHLSYAHAIAAEVAKKLPSEVDSKDVRAAAELGLVEAANSFDPNRGVKFNNYSYHRIKGAIYDALRTIGWFPKVQYQQMRLDMAANEALKDVSPNMQGPASAESKLQSFKTLSANVLNCYMLSLEAMPQEPEDHSHATAEESAMVDELRRKVRTSLYQLPELNRRILEYCYFYDLTLEEVGHKLGLSKSWVCRLHARSLENLREQLNRNSRDTSNARRTTFSARTR